MEGTHESRIASSKPLEIPAVLEAPAILDLTHEVELAIETLEAFEVAGLRLHPELCNMLFETDDHRFDKKTLKNNRRGSGYMQAGRFLTDVFNKKLKERRPAALFDEKSLLEARERSLEASAAFKELLPEQQATLRVCWAEQHEVRLKLDALSDEHRRAEELRMDQERQGERPSSDVERGTEILEGKYLAAQAYDRACYKTEQAYDKIFPLGLPEEYEKIKLDLGKIRDVVSSLKREEDKLIGHMIQDLLDPHPSNSELPFIKEGKYIGTCTTAEEYFLALLNPKKVYEQSTVVKDAQGEPLLIFKQAGEPSALTLRETVLDGVTLPAGSLVAVFSKKSRSDIRSLEDCEGFRFLRLTTLAVSPRHRVRAFGMAMEFQREQGMYQADTTTLEQFMDYAKAQVIKEGMEMH